VEAYRDSGVGGQVLEADAYLAGALGCYSWSIHRRLDCLDGKRKEI
jgi:hypothetical protein